MGEGAEQEEDEYALEETPYDEVIEDIELTFISDIKA
jgi:hypothetical protein